jgi:glycosyltransferase involved in cell wall biosynthesis
MLTLIEIDDQPLQMKLIFILNHYAHDSSSHLYHVIHLLETLAEKGVDIALIIEKGIDKPNIRVKGIRVFPINKPKWIRFIFLAHLLCKLHKKGFDRVFTRISFPAAIVSILVAFFTRQKTYYWQSTQGSREHYETLPANWLKFKIWFRTQLPFRFIIKYITHFVTGPESMMQYYNKVWGVSPDKTIVLYNDVDLQRFKPVETSEKMRLRKKWEISENTTLFLFVHRFSPVRKTNLYFPWLTDEFFEKNTSSDCTFFFAGGGPEKTTIEAIMKGRAYRENVIFSDNIPNTDIQELYQMADIFIQPSWAEGFPRTLIEAMACGLPIVATAAGGVRDLIGKNQQPFIVEVDDLWGFLHRISGLYNDKQMLRVLSEENLQHVKNFGTQAVANMYIERIFAIE